MNNLFLIIIVLTVFIKSTYLQKNLYCDVVFESDAETLIIECGKYNADSWCVMYVAYCDVIENVTYLELRRELKNVRFQSP